MTQKQKKRAIVIGVIILVLLVAGVTGSILLRTNQPNINNQKEDSTENKSGVKYNVGQGQQVTIGFLFEAQKSANKVQTVFHVFVAIFAICCVAYLIYLWYLNWSVRQDKKEKKLADAEEKLNSKKNEE